MTHGCSPFALTRRNLTPLDIVTAHSILPGRDDVALLLEEAMRGQGWTGGRMEQKRKVIDQRSKREKKQNEVRDTLGKVLGIDLAWWDEESDQLLRDSDSDDEEEDEYVYVCPSAFVVAKSHHSEQTPISDYSSMLVFSPASLPHIFDSLITNFQPSFRTSTPANVLYLLARFACLTCDHAWLEELIIGATDAIEETFFVGSRVLHSSSTSSFVQSRADDLICLTFWLYNTTVWLHLLQCDNTINEACEMLGSFDLIEEVINSVFGNVQASFLMAIH